MSGQLCTQELFKNFIIGKVGKCKGVQVVMVHELIKDVGA